MPCSQRSLSRFFPSTLAALAVLVPACGGGETPADVTSDDALLAESESTAGAGHALSFEKETSAAPPKGARLSYYGGPVLAAPAAIAVFWGDGVDPEIEAGIGDFYAAMLASSYVDWLSEYDTTVDAVDGSPGTGQHIGHGTLAGTVMLQPKNQAAKLTDAAIRKELTAQITRGVLPPPKQGTVYLLHFPKGVSIELGGSHSCQSGGFCAYHNSFKRKGVEIDYTVLPDMSPGSGCDSGCGKAARQFDNQTSVASHELIETITDPGVGLSKNLAAPLGWYDSKYGEIGDLCNAQQARLHTKSGKSYVVQKEWSNKSKACVAARSAKGAAEDAWE